MKNLIFTFTLAIISIIIVSGQEDSLFHKKRWLVSAGGNYQFSKVGTSHDIYNSPSYSHDILYSLNNSISPEINISICLDRTQKNLYPVGGFNITDNITHYVSEGFISASQFNQNTTIINLNAVNSFHQISVSPFYGMECRFPVNKKVNLLFSLISVNRFGYYYILDKSNPVENTRTREQDFYFEFNVNFNLSFGFILNTKGKFKPGFMIYKPLLNSQGIFGEEFFLKNYYDQIGCGLLLNF